ncbi:hypothetical protein BGZ65_002688, partial [Modicella reniformis]
EKVSKFQPKIDSMLPRMLNKGGGTTSTKPTPEKRPAGIANNRSSPHATIATSSEFTIKPTTTTSLPAATAGAEASTSAYKSKAKKRPSNPATSIATLIPKGSRAKPLPRKIQDSSAREPLAEQSDKPGGQLEQAIILSSPLPSLSSFMDLNKDKNTDFETQQPHSKVTTPPGITTTRETSTTRTATEKIPSVISVNSLKSDTFASGIPSVQVERIANWMGGVKEAMELNDNSQDLSETPTSLPQVIVIEAPVSKKDIQPDNETSAETTIATGTHRPALRRPPPRNPRHAQAPVSSSPSPSQQLRIRSPDIIIQSSLEEDTPLATAAETSEKTPSETKSVKTKSPISSLPPVPLFHETSDIGERHMKTSGPSSKTTTTTITTIESASTGADAERSGYHHGSDDEDDRSTIVGGQPTQDSFAELASLPSSFTNENIHNVDEKEEEQPKEPSLPSALTSSCLRELGILKRKSSTNRSGPGKRRTERDASLAEEGDEEADENENIILAQREVFPESIGAAPASLTFSSASCNVLEVPTYTFALPNRIRKMEEDSKDLNDDWQPGQRPVPGASMVFERRSFPSIPSHISYSTLPTMPTFISPFPSLDENNRDEELTQEPDLNQTQDLPLSDQDVYSQPSQALLSTLSSMPKIPSLIIIDSQSERSQEDDS